MKQSFISVYMPTHNRLSNLKRAVESILEQDYKNWQLLIVNDGSTDGTLEYLNNLCANDERIRVFHNTTAEGACKARNTAIFAAEGEFITGIDDDDEFTPDRLSYFIKNWSDKYSSLCTPVKVCRAGKEKEHNFFIGELTLEDILVINKIGNQLFCKTKDLQTIKGFDPDFKAWQDYDTWLRFLSAYGKCKKLKRATYLQYEENNELSITRSPNRLIGFQQFYGKHKHLMSPQQQFAMICWKHIISAQWVPLTTLIKSHRDIYRYAIYHNIKKLLGK